MLNTLILPECNMLTQDKYTSRSPNKSSFYKQSNILLEMLQTGIYTTTKLSVQTNVKPSTICRVKFEWQQAGILVVLFRKPCEISGYPADHYTMNRQIIDSYIDGKGDLNA